MDPLSPSRKRRGDSKGGLEQHDMALEEWLCRENITYAQAVARLAEKGVKASVKQLHRWYQRRSEEMVKETILRNVTSGAEAMRAFRKQAEAQGVPQLDELIGWVRVLVAKLSMQGGSEVNAQQINDLLRPVLVWARLQTRKDQLELDREKLDLLKAKAAMADKAMDVAGDGEKSPEERMAAIRGIFGMA